MIETHQSPIHWPAPKPLDLHHPQNIKTTNTKNKTMSDPKLRQHTVTTNTCVGHEPSINNTMSGSFGNCWFTKNSFMVLGLINWN